MHDKIKEKIKARKLNVSIDELYTFNPIYKGIQKKRKSKFLTTSLILISIIGSLYLGNRIKNYHSLPPKPIPRQVVANNNRFTLDNIVSDYNVVISDETLNNPFIINSELVSIIKDHTSSYQREDAKAKAIFNWIENNIKYGDLTRKYGYQNTEEVMDNRMGLCGEMAFLYISMARSVGLKSSFVNVDRDFKGDRVKHACAMVHLRKGDVLVDPAYHRFGVNHKKYKVWDDKEVVRYFNALRR